MCLLEKIQTQTYSLYKLKIKSTMTEKRKVIIDVNLFLYKM